MNFPKKKKRGNEAIILGKTVGLPMAHASPSQDYQSHMAKMRILT